MGYNKIDKISEIIEAQLSLNPPSSKLPTFPLPFAMLVYRLIAIACSLFFLFMIKIRKREYALCDPSRAGWLEDYKERVRPFFHKVNRSYFTNIWRGLIKEVK